MGGAAPALAQSPDDRNPAAKPVILEGETPAEGEKPADGTALTEESADLGIVEVKGEQDQPGFGASVGANGSSDADATEGTKA
jgi:hypothetical protein